MQELKGQRITSQRRLLLDLLRQSEGHLDADELYRRAKEQEPRLSLSTVYRSLRLFKELGLIEERHFIEEHHHYEARSETEHHHVVCRGCGKVIEFECPFASKM
ncbi:MAG: transcriptional repressor, partial [Dehalococcoidia bacterium]|nr:transcriptional repressor [Dehalococcoidia bacterium]